MSRSIKAMTVALLTTAALLAGTPAAAAGPEQSEKYVVTTGRTPMAVTSPNLTMSEGAVNAITCFNYWVEITQYTALGFTHWKWRHVAEACYDGINVTQWRNRYDQLTYTDGTAYAGSQISNSASALPATPGTSFIQRRIDICAFYYGCYWSYNPWSEIKILGNGTMGYSWAVA